MSQSVQPQSAQSYTGVPGAQNLSERVTTTKETRSDTSDILAAKEAAHPSAKATTSPEITPPRRKAPPPKKTQPRPSSSITGSPLLDSFAPSAKEGTIFIPNYQLMGDRFSDRQRNNFQNIALKFSSPPNHRPQPKLTNSTGLATTNLNSKASPNPQTPQTSANTADTQHAAKGVTQARKKIRSAPPKQGDPLDEGHSQNTPIAQPASQLVIQPVKAPSQQNPSQQRIARQASSPNTTVSSPQAEQNTSNRQKADQNTNRSAGQQANASSPRAYGGAQYKASQARAAAGGLVDLEDTLLFGGAEKSNTTLNVGNTLPNARSSSTALLEYLLSTQPSAFFLTKPEGNRAILDDFSALERPDLIRVHTVLNAKNFAVFEPPAKQNKIVQNPDQQSSPQETGELVGLTQQIQQLHQKIEFLSNKLASLDDTAPNGYIKKGASGQ